MLEYPIMAKVLILAVFLGGVMASARFIHFIRYRLMEFSKKLVARKNGFGMKKLEPAVLTQESETLDNDLENAGGEDRPQWETPTERDLESGVVDLKPKTSETCGDPADCHTSKTEIPKSTQTSQEYPTHTFTSHGDDADERGGDKSKKHANKMKNITNKQPGTKQKPKIYSTKVKKMGNNRKRK